MVAMKIEQIWTMYFQSARKSIVSITRFDPTFHVKHEEVG